MTDLRAAYLTAARAAQDLLGRPEVAAAWTRPSALEGFSVGGLAAHLGAQVTAVPNALAKPLPTGTPVTLRDHYDGVTWIGADLDADVNVAIRQNGEQMSADGPDLVRERVAKALAELPAALAAEPADRLIDAPNWTWVLRLDDFLITRMMEISVHNDDLAYSVGLEAPDLPPTVLDPVLTLLSGLAVRRHGQAAVIRALTRSERAPASVSAF